MNVQGKQTGTIVDNTGTVVPTYEDIWTIYSRLFLGFYHPYQDKWNVIELKPGTAAVVAAGLPSPPYVQGLVAAADPIILAFNGSVFEVETQVGLCRSTLGGRRTTCRRNP